MTGQLVVGALTWFAAMGLFAAALHWSVFPANRLPSHPAPSSLARSLNDTRPADGTPTWAVVGAASAHEALVIEVETLHVEEALLVAEEIVEPVRGKYNEVLIYLRRAGSRDTARRVQWTPGGGYVELVYAPAPTR